MARFPRIVLATSNKGKLKELRHRMADHDIEVLGLDDVDSPTEEVAETATTFAGNAILKAVGYGAVAGLPTLADDSGLEVDALGGAPGVRSARFSGPDADALDNNLLLLDRMLGKSDRSARFRCSIALYISPDSDLDALQRELEHHPALHLEIGPEGVPVVVADGATEGSILVAPRGEGGFGYDPLFLSNDLGVTFAEASLDDKGRVSHRGRALDALIPFLIGADGS